MVFGDFFRRTFSVLLHSMKTTTLYRTLATLALAAAITTPSLAADLVPYRGTVAGQINGDLAGVLTSSIRHQGLHVGKGTQETTSIDLGAVASLLGGAEDPIAGTATTYAANGDQLFLEFVLQPLSPLSPEGAVAYTGSYTITGGTGRFDYAAAGISGDLGAGSLDGEAAIEFDGASLTITFSHAFDGTLARPIGK